MATEPRRGRARRVLAGWAVAATALLAAPAPAHAAATPSPSPEVSPSPGAAPTPRPVPATEPWWVRVAFAGRRVDVVTAGSVVVTVLIGGRAQVSADEGRTWQPALANPDAGAAQPGPRWRVAAGRVVERPPASPGGIPLTPDPGSPQMAPLAARDRHGPIAAPAALPGVVVAVDRDGVVWRRGADGRWARALLLLPQRIGAGTPRITAAAAFERQPLSDAVYLATDGYSVLESTDGGDDWIRAGPGLPDRVLGLAADDRTQSVYAATGDGLWVHHLRATPAPPSYPDAALHWRWLGIALVTLAAAALGTGGLLRALR